MNEEQRNQTIEEIKKIVGDELTYTQGRGLVIGVDEESIISTEELRRIIAYCDERDILYYICKDGLRLY